jgi:hypothetical protein
MPRWSLAALIFCLLTANGRANPSILPELSPGEQCRGAIATAERGHAIPAQLMAAIGRVESGRRDPGSGAWGAWPWTINAEGQGFYFNTKAEAIKAVETLQARGVRSIDVGCMQVNLMHHPTAFANLDMAFEPAVNTDYAARFLVQLHGQTGDWTRATANYHSANPAEGEPYAAKVAAIWPEEQRKAGLAPPLFGPGMAGAGMAGAGMVGRGMAAPGVLAPFARAMPPMPGREPPRMFAMAARTPAGMLRGQTAGGGGAASSVALPSMMQGGTIPAGTLPPGAMAALARSGGASPPGMATPGPGRGLDFYRAMPVGMVMPLHVATRVANRITMR